MSRATPPGVSSDATVQPRVWSASRSAGGISTCRESPRALLCARLQPGTVQWGCKLDSITCGSERSSHSVLTFNEGARTVEADVVVGADGIRSAVRPAAVREASELRALGVVVILGYARCDHALCVRSDTVFEQLDGVTRLYAMPFTPPPGATTMWQLSFPMPEAQARELARGGGGLLGHAPGLPDGRPQSPSCSALRILDVTGYPVYDVPSSSACVRATAHTLATPRTPWRPSKRGANQALVDALAQALYDSELGDEAAAKLGAEADGVLLRRDGVRRSRRPVLDAIDGCERAAAVRAMAKVEASRMATTQHTRASTCGRAGVTRAAAAAAAGRTGSGSS